MLRFAMEIHVFSSAFNDISFEAGQETVKPCWQQDQPCPGRRGRMKMKTESPAAERLRIVSSRVSTDGAEGSRSSACFMVVIVTSALIAQP